MSKSIRVRTTPNGDDKYIKVELKQDFDLLEILSLKIKQKDLYQNFCSNYGVIAGRVIVNNGFGLPNVKISIFIPIDAEDLENSVIRQIYPYESPSKDDKNVQGVRYNLLPNQQQTFDHTPIGTFNTKAEILDNQVSLEIYDKYYKFTTTTNEAGDFILFGVPTGNHILHYDVDVSDIGFLSLRPYDLVERGFSKELFLSPFKFKRDSNLDNLPQVLTQNLNVLVEPFWCDDLSDGRIIGITRQDIDITSVDLTPSATFFGSIFSDDEKDSINKNCRPRRKTGKLDEVITTSGNLEAIRRNIDGDIKKYEIPDDAIDDNGNWALQLPMNIRKVVTDEFGNLVPSPDGVSGIATEADFRFRISMDKTDSDKRLRQRAKYLVPNMTGNYKFDEYSAAQLQEGGDETFKLNEKLSTLTNGTPYSADTSNQYNYLEDFFTFRWKKVYTIRQFIGRYQKYKNDEKRSFLGIKHIINAQGVNKFPNNRADTNVNPLYSIMCIIMQTLGIIFALINSIINVINSIITMLCQIKIPTAIDVFSLKGGQMKIKTRLSIYDDAASPKWVVQSVEPWAGHIYHWTRTCFDAKTTCDDVNQIKSCTKDLRNCFVKTNGGDFPEYMIEYFYIGLPDYPSLDNERQHLDGGFWDSCGRNKSPAYGYSDGWCYQSRLYSNTGTPSSPNNGDRRRAFYGGVNLDETRETAGNTCRKCELAATCPSGYIQFLGACWGLKGKCLVAPLFCKKCGSACGSDAGGPLGHSCCRCDNGSCSGCKSTYEQPKDATLQNYDGTIWDQVWGCPCKPSPGQKNVKQVGDQCCGQCCVKIPMIKLKCDEVSGWVPKAPTLFPTPIAHKACNQTLIKGACAHCGGLDLPFIGQWVACKLEGLAASLDMLKLDFYNDWVNGTLYFPLIKRKYKLKKRKKKFGQIKKDKFCDFDCSDFQSDYTYEYRTIIKNTKNYDVEFIFDDCKYIFKPDEIITTNWRSKDTTQPTSFEKALLSLQEIQLVGENIFTGDDCIIKGTIDVKNAIQSTGGALVWEQYPDIDCNKRISNKHGKPKYVSIEDPVTGIDMQINTGGHGHHQNKCNKVFRLEKTEFWQDNQDCKAAEYDPDAQVDTGVEIDESESDEGDEEEITGCPGEDPNYQCAINSCSNWATCSCTSAGIFGDAVLPACCACTFHYNNHPIRHGIVKWEDGVIYYASIITDSDSQYNNEPDEYKGNLLLPTDICELGSSVFCDIDEVPFIMDQLPPTTYQVSEESERFISDGGNGDFNNPFIYTTRDQIGDSKVNLGVYVSFSCFAAKCLSTMPIVNQSQIGVDMLDRADVGLEIGPCKIYFDHDEEIREYFCKRFSGFDSTGANLTVNYQRPGSPEFENVYEKYPEATITGSSMGWYEVDGGPPEIDSINDGDPFLMGDKCGIKQNYNTSNPPVKYFYGLAPGWVNFFNGGTGVGAFSPKFPTPSSIATASSPLVQQGINFATSQTPYYFYFGIVPGKTALHKVVSRYFADKINKTTLAGLGDTKSSANLHNKSNFRDNIKNPFSILKSCLGEKIILPD